MYFPCTFDVHSMYFRCTFDVHSMYFEVLFLYLPRPEIGLHLPGILHSVQCAADFCCPVNTGRMRSFMLDDWPLLLSNAGLMLVFLQGYCNPRAPQSIVCYTNCINFRCRL